MASRMSTGLLFVFLKNNIQVSYMHFKDKKKLVTRVIDPTKLNKFVLF